MSAFSFLLLVIFFIDLSNSTIEKLASHVALAVATRKVFKIKKKASTTFCSLPISECAAQISRKTVDFTYAINSLKDEGFARNTSARFRLLEIYKHVTPFQRDMSTQKAANQ